jgi:hypothetical protein
MKLFLTGLARQPPEAGGMAGSFRPARVDESRMGFALTLVSCTASTVPIR